MSGLSRFSGSVRWLVAWSVLVFPTLAWGQEATLAQQIGEVSSEVADAVGAEVTVVPFSPDIDARTTPIIVAPGEAFVHQGRPGQVGGLSGAERKAIRQAYAAGQTILLLHPSVHDVEALHVLVEDGVTQRSTSEHAVLAYALRQEGDIPTVRIVHDLPPSLRAPGGIGPDIEDEEALQRALDVIVSELTHPPVLAAAPRPTSPAAGPADWKQNPVQTGIISWTAAGNFNTPIEIYALHSCQENKDYYLVNTGGDWTATEAAFSSADSGVVLPGGDLEISRNTGPDAAENPLIIEWDPSPLLYCGAGEPVFDGAQRICRYGPYPLWYEVDIVPPAGPTVLQVNAAPAGDQGQSADYTSGFSFSIGGEVDISGDGPNAGIAAGVTWENDVTTTVPPLVIEAGDTGPGNQGTFTRYRYCTVGSSPGCTSNIQLRDVGGLCQQDVTDFPQQGQTGNGRLSNVAQTVYWQVDPATYGGRETFEVTVTWQVNLAVSQALFWNGQFTQFQVSGPPTGGCNVFGCSCTYPFTSAIAALSAIFDVPIPSGSNCSSG
jgi:hypothetical protein